MARSLLASLALVALIAVGHGPLAAAAPPVREQIGVASDIPADAEPNVLLVILDDIGLDFFPGFEEGAGFDKAPMPRMEQLMDDGFVFTGLHTYSMCSPTRASLLTGKHGVETGVLDPGRTSLLDTSFQSIQEELDVATGGSIATSIFGKWHLVGNQSDTLLDYPNQFGADHYAGIISGNHDDYSDWPKTTNGVRTQSSTYSTTEFTNDAIDWIGDQDGQWFTWLAYTAPHSPIHLPPAELHSFDALTGDQTDLRRNRDEYFKAMLESVDTEIGRLLDSFDTETRDNTFVFVIGDNGTGSAVAQPRYGDVGAKGSLHVGGINTPMIAYSPYTDGGGTEYDDLISTIDYFPTIFDLLDLTPSAALDLKGTSFAPLITGMADQYIENDHAFAQSPDSVAVRSQTHKLLRLDPDEERFYDITTDRFEESNLIGTTLSASDQAEYDRLSELLDRYMTGDYEPTAGGADAPTAADDGPLAVEANQTITVAVTDNDTVPDGETIESVELVGQPTLGTASVTGLDIEYRAGPGPAQTVAFDYRLCTGVNACDTATVRVTLALPDGLALCNGRSPTMVAPDDGTPVVGTTGDDVILGTIGADTIDGAGGNDTICGDSGDDTLQGGTGDDRLFGAQGADRIDGGDGDDTIHGNRGEDILNGNEGADRIFGYSESDTISGGPGDDRLHGNFGDDVINGGDGDDNIFGYGDNDQLSGGAGADLLGGNFGDDVLNGGADDDVLYGSDGTDTVSGGDGDDLVQGNSGTDTVHGNDGNDTLDGGINADTCDGGAGTDTATRCETLVDIP